ncbi:hypothetical protein ACOME3_009178 [Neoechinorhynchus agilis]
MAIADYGLFNNPKRRTQSGADHQTLTVLASSKLHTSDRFTHHRKTRSDVTCFQTKRKLDDLKNKSLLDDSVLDEDADTRRSSTESPPLEEPCCRMVSRNFRESLLRSVRFPGLSSGVFSPNDKNSTTAMQNEVRVKIKFEGPLARRTLLRGFKNPLYGGWRTLWVSLTSQCHLMLFKPISMSSVSMAWIFSSKMNLKERKAFAVKPYKCYGLTSRCMLFMLDDQDGLGKESTNQFQLNDLRKGNVYKFRADDHENAKKWFENLSGAIKRLKRQQKPGWPTYSKLCEKNKGEQITAELKTDADSCSNWSADDNDLIYFD